MGNDLKLDAVKIGTMVNKDNLRITRNFLEHISLEYTRLKSVLDPLFLSSTGYPLLENLPAWI